MTKEFPMTHTNSQRQSVSWVGRRCCAAGDDGRAATRPYRLGNVPIIIGKWYQFRNRPTHFCCHWSFGLGHSSLNPNSEVAGGGGLDEAMPECARPRAQQLASFEPRNIFQPPAQPTWLRLGRSHSANAEIQLRHSSLNLPLLFAVEN